ncbi:MAG TPA: histidine kinase dimerization/phosphoacceptor domain -containing protein [Rhizobiaceae bacterium]
MIMLAALAALASLMVWQNYKAALNAAEARAVSSAQVVAAHIEWMMEASDQALRRIDAAIGDNPVGSAHNAVADIRAAVGDLPEGFQYSVYDETGSLRYSSVPEAVGIRVSDREYFQRLRDGEPMVISPQLEERLSGERVFVVARAITRKGKFHGAASIAIPTKSMDEFWSLLELGPRSTVGVVRTDGWLVARHPQLPETIDLSGTPLFTDHVPASQAGFYHNASTVADGLSRIIGYRSLEHWPIVATTGIERSEALQAFWVSLRGGLLVGVPLLSLLVLGIFWILRLLRTDAEQRSALEQALQRNKFLMREIHHRVKNNLQAVSALVRLQPLPQDLKNDMARRIAAMVAVHEQIYGADQFEHIDVGPYVERLTREVAEGFRGHVTIETQLEPLRLGPDQALPLGLIINEVVTNAFKHAFSNRTDGRLVVKLSVDGKMARLAIEDDGPGYQPGRKGGMGSKLIDGFVAQLRGTLDVAAASGTTVVVSFPLD